MNISILEFITYLFGAMGVITLIVLVVDRIQYHKYYDQISNEVREANRLDRIRLSKAA